MDILSVLFLSEHSVLTKKQNAESMCFPPSWFLVVRICGFDKDLLVVGCKLRFRVVASAW